MFNTLCWYLNVLGLARFVAWLRRTLLALFACHARQWEYAKVPCAGYRGGVDIPYLGTVAFIPWVEGNPDVPYVYQW